MSRLVLIILVYVLMYAPMSAIAYDNDIAAENDTIIGYVGIGSTITPDPLNSIIVIAAEEGCQCSSYFTGCPNGNRNACIRSENPKCEEEPAGQQAKCERCIRVCCTQQCPSRP